MGPLLTATPPLQVCWWFLPEPVPQLSELSELVSELVSQPPLWSPTMYTLLVLVSPEELPLLLAELDLVSADMVLLLEEPAMEPLLMFMGTMSQPREPTLLLPQLPTLLLPMVPTLLFPP